MIALTFGGGSLECIRVHARNISCLCGVRIYIQRGMWGMTPKSRHAVGILRTLRDSVGKIQCMKANDLKTDQLQEFLRWRRDGNECASTFSKAVSQAHALHRTPIDDP